MRRARSVPQSPRSTMILHRSPVPRECGRDIFPAIPTWRVCRGRCSVACTGDRRQRFFRGDANGRVLRGSVLDRDFMAGLGPADIVYSWGVLHHTGAMQAAFANVKALVPVGGRLFIAIYNDLSEVTD